ncbi:hypothetical protein GOFOIKOB_6361 [Methylobacterium tardum]|uniref:Transposase TnpC homeodomain domain-containing protein n=1 Tax=Methylobacterium tardum TaxID=374432 RepID=A0AA37T7I6_9HYPH|nr:hypothetical protein GOFOIKOB_6361 [Methylobacterium tardum]GLS68121.1 hypothetical protein GCM10007890_01320 [Methylobacterium tardum]
MSEPTRRLELFTGAGRRRTWTDEEKAAIITESDGRGTSASAVARRHGLSASQLFTWRRLARQAGRLDDRTTQRHRFGRRAESLLEDQLLFGLDEAEQVEAAGFAAEESEPTKNEESEPAKKEARRAKRRTNRGALSAHLPRVECLVDIDSTASPCCAGTLHRIGEDVSECLDVVPA